MPGPLVISRMTTWLGTALVGNELFPMVATAAGAPANFAIPSQTLAQFMVAFPALNTVIVTTGATLIAPYVASTTDTRILFNKTASATSGLLLPLSQSMAYPSGVIVKDTRGDAGSFPITITFSGGQSCDGLTQLQILDAYGWFAVNPIPNNNGWYLTS